jgi:hypothetical protein
MVALGPTDVRMSSMAGEKMSFLAALTKEAKDHVLETVLQNMQDDLEIKMADSDIGATESDSDDDEDEDDKFKKVSTSKAGPSKSKTKVTKGKSADPFKAKGKTTKKGKAKTEAVAESGGMKPKKSKVKAQMVDAETVEGGSSKPAEANRKSTTEVEVEDVAASGCKDPSAGIIHDGNAKPATEQSTKGHLESESTTLVSVDNNMNVGNTKQTAVAMSIPGVDGVQGRKSAAARPIEFVSAPPEVESNGMPPTNWDRTLSETKRIQGKLEKRKAGSPAKSPLEPKRSRLVASIPTFVDIHTRRPGGDGPLSQISAFRYTSKLTVPLCFVHSYTEFLKSHRKAMPHHKNQLMNSPQLQWRPLMENHHQASVVFSRIQRRTPHPRPVPELTRDLALREE